MRPTRNELMGNVGCQMWPVRWRDIYDDVMEHFERQGCCMTDPDYIDTLAERYQILENQRELYSEAALSIAAQGPLARLLMLLCAALADTEYRGEDITQFYARTPLRPAGTARSSWCCGRQPGQKRQTIIWNGPAPDLTYQIRRTLRKTYGKEYSPLTVIDA